MEKIIWSDDWILDIDGVDKQHKKLINILNRIIDRNIDTQELIYELIEYAATHFADEEEFMFDNNYPNDLYQLHKREHRKFTDTLLQTSFKITSAHFENDTELTERLIAKFEEFCFKWFRLHFLGTDKDFGDYLKGGANVDPKQ